jgi:hypothetical protein
MTQTTTTKLATILKDSDYKLGQFLPEQKADLEARITSKEDKKRANRFLCDLFGS